VAVDMGDICSRVAHYEFRARSRTNAVVLVGLPILGLGNTPALSGFFSSVFNWLKYFIRIRHFLDRCDFVCCRG
jgi:hypothetical protein